MRVLIVTNVFPNAAMPLSSPFNRLQFGALDRLVDTEVLATVPYFPGLRTEDQRKIPATERIDDVQVEHPRTLYLPKLPVASGLLYAASLLPHLFRRNSMPDVVLASWAYPDGCAAIALARALGLPVVVKLHGSDIDVISKMPGPRAQLRWLLPMADRVVAVSRSLADAAAELGVARERIDVVPNGVDTQLFRPGSKTEARRELGLSEHAPTVLYVGRLHPDKGIFDLVGAFERVIAERSDARLLMVGNGPEAERLKAAAGRVSPNIQLLGSMPPEQVARYMTAADVVTLPSYHEGMPNVLREALACGRPVVATRVGGIVELVSDSVLGALVAPQNEAELANALLEQIQRPAKPLRILRASGTISWTRSAELLYSTLSAAASDRLSLKEVA